MARHDPPKPRAVPPKPPVVAESERLAAESHLAIARSLIVLEEVRALRQKAAPTAEEIFEAIARRQLDALDQADGPADPADRDDAQA